MSEQRGGEGDYFNQYEANQPWLLTAAYVIGRGLFDLLLSGMKIPGAILATIRSFSPEEKEAAEKGILDAERDSQKYGPQ